jgi:hypothetical protein
MGDMKNPHPTGGGQDHFFREASPRRNSLALILNAPHFDTK